MEIQHFLSRALYVFAGATFGIASQVINGATYTTPEIALSAAGGLAMLISAAIVENGGEI